MASARGLWRATGVQEADFGKPIIAVCNSFTQFVPGHVHLKDLGQMVCEEIQRAGGIAKEFNTIAVDDGIAMGHDGILCSLPSRDHSRQRSVYDQCALHQCTGVYFKLRLDYARYAYGYYAIEHTNNFCIWRANGSRKSHVGRGISFVGYG